LSEKLRQRGIDMTVDARPLSRTLSAIVAEFELEQASYVTLEQIAAIATRSGIASSARDLAWRLRKAGWLLDTPARGVWEFAPAENAGPFGRGDAFALLRGLLERRSMATARVCLISALWLRGWSERAPSRHEVAIARDTIPPAGAKVGYQMYRFDSRLSPETIRGLPVELPAATLVHIATRPSRVTSWETIAGALPNLAANTDGNELRTELEGRPPTVSARLGYLLEGVAPHLIEDVGLRPTTTVTHIGPHDVPARYNSYWNIADSEMPLDPRGIAPLNSDGDLDTARTIKRRRRGGQ
jgi:predicted transcriptional regulator of viral defense system